MAISLWAKTSYYIDIEIHKRVHRLSDKIWAASAQSLLECDLNTFILSTNCFLKFRKSYLKADYSLAGIGSCAKSIKGKLWNIRLRDSSGKLHVTKGF